MPDDDAVAGPSGQGSHRRSIRWNNADEASDESSDPRRALRRQSLVGTSGYVSQLLEQSLETEEATRRGLEEEEARRPIRRQSVAERRDSMRAATADMEYYMREALDSKARRKSSSVRRRSRSDSKVLPSLTSEDKLEELQIVTAQTPVEDRPSSEWVPSHLLEAEVGARTEISWLGTYVVGKDYWTESGGPEEQEEKVTYDKVEEKTSWYDMPIKKAEKGPESIFQSMKNRFQDKFDDLKDEIDEEYEEKRKQRMISAAHAREAPAAEEWGDEFRQCFEDVCRWGDQRGCDRISMCDADRWLERAQLLDHSRLTTLHTGFCFIASGGGRHMGLDFDKFTVFLQMISPATGLAVRDLARRMTACLRKAGG